MPAWDDLSQFIDTDDFGVLATVTLASGGTKVFPVLFDDPAVDLKFDQRRPMSGGVGAGDYTADMDRPRMVASVENLAGVKRRDSAIIEGKTYGVLSDPQPDGNGFATVVLVMES